MVVARLQLGTSRLERLSPAALDVFLDHSWLHLGEQESPNQGLLARFRDHTGRRGLLSALRTAPGALVRTALNRDAPHVASANFEPFHFSLDDPLRFEDGQFDYIFAEHFLEHLFLDEALHLVDEACRLLRAGGVVRFVLPDADFRRNERPEPAGYPRRAMAWTHPDKHKSRWSVRSLPAVMRRAGLAPHSVQHHDELGVLHKEPPEAAEWFPRCNDAEMVGRLDYLQRPESLIVDGFKP